MGYIAREFNFPIKYLFLRSIEPHRARTRVPRQCAQNLEFQILMWLLRGGSLIDCYLPGHKVTFSDEQDVTAEIKAF